jgi:aminopeptidase N
MSGYLSSKIKVFKERVFSLILTTSPGRCLGFVFDGHSGFYIFRYPVCSCRSLTSTSGLLPASGMTMKNAFFLLLIIPSLAFCSPAADIDIEHYTFRITLHDSTDNIEGTAEIRLSCKKDLDKFGLDLVCRGAQGKGMQVSAIMMNGNPLKFSHQNDRLKIALSTSASAGDRLTLSVIYRGIPQDGLIISRNKFGDRTFFADNWPNRGHNWLPVVDHPADKASVDFIVTAPLHYEVISNGIKIEESFLNGRQKLTHYREEAPISTKVMVIGVARFAVQRTDVVNHIPVEAWVYPQNREQGFRDYAAAAKILNFFIGRIGDYPYKKLANVQSKTTFGGLENASAIFYFENSVTGKADQETLIAHEIAHQWFGNSASEKEWHHLWLSEGFATYFALLYNEFTYGVAKRQKEMQLDRDQVIAFFKEMPIPVVNPATTDLMALLNANNYQKGSWVLHMLRREVGDPAFWKGIREYYRRFQNNNALTSDFQEAMEAASGKDLDLFFDQWIYKAGHPVLETGWKYDEKAKNLQFTVKQVQKGPIFSFPIEVGIFYNNEKSPQTEKILINRELQQLNIPVAQKPRNIALDPGVNLLFEDKTGN